MPEHRWRYVKALGGTIRFRNRPDPVDYSLNRLRRQSADPTDGRIARCLPEWYDRIA